MEKALQEAYTELRHYALTHTSAACGSQRVGLFTTNRKHVTCVACLDVMGEPLWWLPKNHPEQVQHDHPRTLGDSALKELAELREGVKRLVEVYEVQAGYGSPNFAGVAADLRGLLEPKTEGGGG